MARIDKNGMNQEDLVTLLNTIITNFNAVLTKLDSDAGVTDTNYSSTYAITDTVDS